jgi:hypothetical protein
VKFLKKDFQDLGGKYFEKNPQTFWSKFFARNVKNFVKQKDKEVAFASMKKM